MESAPDHVLPGRRHASFKSRATSFLIALAIEILIVIGLLTLAPRTPPVKKSTPVTFSMYPSPDHQATPKPSPHKARSKSTSSAAAPARLAPDATTVPQTAKPPVNPLLNDKELFEAADISKLGSHSNDDSDSPDTGSVYGPGEGPGGERLYNAEWVREPTDAELSTYMPPTGVPLGSWAMIACKTIPNFQVENCRSLGESPVGSGLARGLRLAAWQFRVRPPRVGGKALMGVWVRIRLDFTKEAHRK
jgi:hypothetical protein